MNLINPDMCSLCSEIFSSSERILINNDIMELLTFLVVKIDTSFLENTQICKGCSEKIQDASNFKLSFEKFRISITIKKELDNETCMCRICGAVIEKCSTASLLDFMENFESVMHYLTEELDLELLENPRICLPCQESVSNLQFIMNKLSNWDRNRQDKNNTNILSEHQSHDIQSINHTNYSEKKMQIKNEDSENCINENGYFMSEDLSCKNEEINLKVEVKSEYEQFEMNSGKITNNEEPWNYIEKVSPASTKTTAKTNLKSRMSSDKIAVFKCDYCGYKTKHKKSLRRHIMSHENKDNIKCQLCDYKTYDKDLFKSHMIVHKDISEINMFECEKCDFKTKRRGGLRKHLLVHKNLDEINYFVCDKCEFKTKQRDGLVRHLLIHNEAKRFKCDTCGFQTNHLYNMNQHKNLHKNIEELQVFQCNECTYCTTNKNYLTKHAFVHKKDDEIEFIKCKFCDFKAKQASNIRQHLLTHEKFDDTKHYKCKVCGYKAKRQDHLKGHMLVHKNVNEIQAFICDICGYKAKQKRYLKSHILNHLNKKITKDGVKKTTKKNQPMKKKK